MMHCPVDQTTLQMTDRQGVEIDYCPQCRGVWLDRGELDKILDRTAEQFDAPVTEAPARPSTPPPAPPQYQAPAGQQYGMPSQPYAPGSQAYRGNAPHRRRKKSFLDDMFDFG